ncbi:hypothetical protein NEMBOFW57_002664 [Staphylotrichum longicolle]|uniref:Threonylcarbamoyl-AMP synthase n=1 Tax=Staphylotrichum longicolle TaxID=669026 RepID=A0AAD4F4I3_9PEZI|nr:hypothetical protein NEMBOFW57_002664 [Staphylotrichum longicolle]
MKTRILKVPLADGDESALGHWAATHPDGTPDLTTWTVPDSPSSAVLAPLHEAAHLLRTTDVPVAFPTETVYGLGADATRSAAVRGIYSAKGRPSDNPLIVHHHNYLTATLPTFGARMPASPLARTLIALTAAPLAAPSANASTRPSPTAAQHVREDLQGRIELVLDGGSCAVGVESTVVDGLCDPPVVLRPGGVGIEELRRVGGGGSGCRRQTGRLLDVDLGGDVKGVAHGLFAALRELDRLGADVILVEGVSDGDDIAAAVMNRLRKAASEIRA